MKQLTILYIPADRPLEFKLYSYGPITSFWIPQLGGQKYAMSDMVNTLHLAADVPGELYGYEMRTSVVKVLLKIHFNVDSYASSMSSMNGLKKLQATAEPITEEKFDELLEPGHLGRSTYTGTHLEFLTSYHEHNHRLRS